MCYVIDCKVRIEAARVDGMVQEGLSELPYLSRDLNTASTWISACRALQVQGRGPAKALQLEHRQVEKLQSSHRT